MLPPCLQNHVDNKLIPLLAPGHYLAGLKTIKLGPVSPESIDDEDLPCMTVYVTSGKDASGDNLRLELGGHIVHEIHTRPKDEEIGSAMMTALTLCYGTDGTDGFLPAMVDPDLHLQTMEHPTIADFHFDLTLDMHAIAFKPGSGQSYSIQIPVKFYMMFNPG